MAYQTGTAANLAAVVDAVRSFGTSLGWITDRHDNGLWAFHSPDLKNFFALRSSTGARGEGIASIGASPHPANGVLIVYGYSYHDPDKALEWQPGGVFETAGNSHIPYMSLYSSFYELSYFLFGTSEYIHIVIRDRDGIYSHASVGVLDKKGMEFTGGQYLQGNGTLESEFSLYGSRHLWDNDGRHGLVRVAGTDGVADPFWYPSIGSGAGRDARHPDAGIIAASANEFTGDTILVPCRVLMLGALNRRWFLGEPRDFAVVSMFNSNPEQILTYGAEEWQVFPSAKKDRLRSSSGVRPFSGDVGYAYRVRR